VDPRLRKLASESWDGMILAASGLKRLGLTPGNVQPLDPEAFVPAVGQGVLAVEIRADDHVGRARLAGLDHGPTRACALAEREFLAPLRAPRTPPLTPLPPPSPG